MMLYTLFKTLLSAVLITVVSETAKRSPALGALVASLPLVSVLAMLWMWRETGDTARIADHAEATFWYVLPSLPMFLVLPALLRGGVHFYPALLASCGLTVLLYLVTIWVCNRFGMQL